MNINFITSNFNEHNIQYENIMKLANGFIKFHKKMLKDSKEERYDKDGKTRNGMLALIDDILNDRRNSQNFVLCLVEDIEKQADKIVGFSLAEKPSMGKDWKIPCTFLDEDYRGKKVGDKKISQMIYENIEKEVRKRGGKSIGSTIYGANTRSLRFRLNNGFHPVDPEINKLIAGKQIDDKLKSICEVYKNKQVEVQKDLTK